MKNGVNQNITLLIGNNWESWKHEVKVLHFGAWEFMEKPVQESNAVKPTTKSEKTVAEDSKPEYDSLTWRE